MAAYPGTSEQEAVGAVRAKSGSAHSSGYEIEPIGDKSVAAFPPLAAVRRYRPQEQFVLPSLVAGGHGRLLACGRARSVHRTRQRASGCTWLVLVSWACVGWKRTRETPALGMQPTRVSFWVLVTAQRAHRGTPISCQGDGKSPACPSIARPLERDEANAMNKTGRKRLFILANHQEHCAGTFACRCHREHEPPTGLERVQPGWKGVRRAGARDDDINRVERGARPVNVTDGHLRPWLERDTCLLGEVR